MSTELVPIAVESKALPVPWKDPHAVLPEALTEYTRMLEKACEENPKSVELRVCLGMVYAMGYEAYKSMDSLEMAVSMDPENFWARMKYAELNFRLRSLLVAEEETQKAVELARNYWELSMARKQLQQIRALMRDGTQRPAWTKPLTRPVLMLGLMLLITFLVMRV
jgi:hypothetical protein